ncbi:SMI1/KNR4 family protein [Streptomyces sp. TLI_053]|uniref:SMI1/KNR4 family protein n=1 Tax=Streptomyces sp. TLI_053 TaxID=1855352 RepID=UPI00135210EE|nr:SMI1/KNR4 family protein [Streptomyces sp. TLI_053]
MDSTLTFENRVKAEVNGSHSAINQLSLMLRISTAGGDVVDWGEVEGVTGLRLPADYRDFVALCGGSELNEYLAFRTPPVDGSPVGNLLDGLDFDPREEYRSSHELGLMDPSEMRLLPFAATANGDVAFWVCESIDPEAWEVATFKRQARFGVGPWKRFEMGFGRFLVGLLDGTLPNPFSDSSWNVPPHAYRNWRDF